MQGAIRFMENPIAQIIFGSLFHAQRRKFLLVTLDEIWLLAFMLDHFSEMSWNPIFSVLDKVEELQHLQEECLFSAGEFIDGGEHIPQLQFEFSH